MPLVAYYVLPGGTNVFRQKWYTAQVPAVQAGCEYAIREFMASTELDHSPVFKTLTKQHVGLSEIKFRAKDPTGLRQFRLLGFWNYDSTNFILVTGGRKPIPEIVFNDALNVLEQFIRYGQGSIDEYRF